MIAEEDLILQIIQNLPSKNFSRIGMKNERCLFLKVADNNFDMLNKNVQGKYRKKSGNGSRSHRAVSL
jgi:hypothetical protein